MPRYEPLPTQLSGAQFLAARQVALLADEPRVGKTGAAIIASDYVLAHKILVVTTASGRPVWKRGFQDWSAHGRPAQILDPAKATITADIVIVGWPNVSNAKVQAALLRFKPDLVILDESHYAKNHEAKRTEAVYGLFMSGGRNLDVTTALVGRSRVWLLSGTPLPHSPADAYAMLRALDPVRLAADPAKDWPDVTRYQDFLHRFCIVRMKKLSRFNSIPVVMGGKNTDELAARMDGFYLRRTQADVGIRKPIYEILPLLVTDRVRTSLETQVDRAAVLTAIDENSTKALDMHLGPLRRLTGEIKAHAVVEALKDEFASGLDKIVLMFWHRDVGDILMEALKDYGPVKLDGSTPAAQREAAVAGFSTDPKCRVFLGQIQAAGEAIDLSAAAELIFVETSFTPKDMAQAALRITNHSQSRQARVRVAAIDGSLDEAMQSRLMTLWTAIKEVIK